MLLKSAIFCLLVALVVADDFLYIDELEDLVSGNDRYLLKQLDDDEFTPRTQIQQQFNTILSRQSTQVQSAYRQIVASKQQRDAAEDARELQRAQSMGVADLWTQLESIEKDLSLSEYQAKQEKRRIYNGLPNNQRRLLENIDD